MDKYYFCRHHGATTPELAVVVFATPDAAILNWLLYNHPTAKYVCKLTRPDHMPNGPYQLTTARPKDLVSLLLCETDHVEKDDVGFTLYGNEDTVVKAITDCPIRDLCEAYRIPLLIEKH